METENGKHRGGTAKKLLMPLVATAVSAAATYAGKRAPRLLEDTVMPKLRDATSGTEDLASGLADRAKAVVGRGDDGSAGSTPRSSGSRGSFSSEELERRRSKRAEQRANRRKAASGSRS